MSVTAATFKPTFRTNVGVILVLQSNNNTPTFSGINPLYCATDQTAADLASVLADLNPTVVEDWPEPGWPVSNTYYQTAKVPYLKFPDGTVVNAGEEASFFTHGYPPAFAESAVRGDIAMAMQFTAQANNS